MESRARTAVGVALLVFLFVALAFWYSSARQNFVISRGALEDAAPHLVETYRDSANTGVETCRTVHETKPFEFHAVCYFGTSNHRTIMFVKDGEDYRASRGVFYRPDDAGEKPDGVCTRHIFGRWWEFASIQKTEPNCPSGFDHYTGEG